MRISVGASEFLATTETPFAEDRVSERRGMTPGQIAEFMSESGSWNVLQDDPDMKGRHRLAAELICAPQEFFVNPSKKILRPSDGQLSLPAVLERKWKFRSTAEKEFALNMIERYLAAEVAGAKGIAQTILGIADELFTNALFNAPFGDLESTLDRSTVVVLDPEMASEIIIGHTDERLFVGCIDSFGTLNCENLLDRINHGFNEGFAQSVNMEVGGAGIGILRMIDLSADIYVIVEKEKKTLVGCSFVLKRSPKKIRQSGKSFHFQSFETVKSQTGKIRIERRGHRGTLRVTGYTAEDFPFGEIDLSGITEVNLDLKDLVPEDLKHLPALVETLKSALTIKNLSFGCVPFELYRENEKFFIESGLVSQVKSLVAPVTCPSCGFETALFFVRNAKDETEPVCPECQKVLDQNFQNPYSKRRFK